MTIRSDEYEDEPLTQINNSIYERNKMEKWEYTGTDHWVYMMMSSFDFGFQDSEEEIKEYCEEEGEEYSEEICQYRIELLNNFSILERFLKKFILSDWNGSSISDFKEDELWKYVNEKSDIKDLFM